MTLITSSKARKRPRHAILSVELPRDLEAEILEAYDQLFEGTGHPYSGRGVSGSCQRPVLVVSENVIGLVRRRSSGGELLDWPELQS
jgi:hypothetical protein